MYTLCVLTKKSEIKSISWHARFDAGVRVDASNNVVNPLEAFGHRQKVGDHIASHSVVAEHQCVPCGVQLRINHWRPLLLPVGVENIHHIKSQSK